jgi:hypothetical protein
MHKGFSPKSIQRRLFYEQYYEILTHIELPPGKRKYIGNRANRTCRYCAQSSPATMFRTVAHTFPEFIGNKTLISYDECDPCNDKFSNTIDVHLARYLGIESTIAQIPGKRGIPTYKVPGKAPRLEYSTKENMLQAQAGSVDDFIEISENEKRVLIHAYRQPYRKRSAYKCLVKMALAIIPEQELCNFRHTLDWLNIRNPEDDTLKTSMLLCLRSRSPASLRAIDALLLRRRDPNAPVPYVTFFIAFYNFSFQIFLPLSHKDQHLMGQDLQICHFPTKMENFSEVTYFRACCPKESLGRFHV